jgi:glutamyl-tRNA reductase
MINDNDIYKIKDSVDLFLSNESYILAYFMNTRQRKSFRVNKEAVHLLECIDGTRNLAEIKEIMQNRYNIVSEYVNNTIKTMESAHIITKVNKNHNILSKDELQRYSRQINYFGEFLESEEKGIEAQKNIINSTIIIFGIGAVGGSIAIELAMAGVGKIILYDFDKVEVSDACRHMYFKEKYINANKTVALKKNWKK